jgi:two-component system sensor histidine kinase and response regulator WspE
MSNDPHDMMLELFRSEVESHSDMLTSSLLALEQEPSASTLERMMRAAHSIKGAARIVQVTPAVEVAHVMEDCFVAAQKGNLVITPDDVDVLLKGVDLLAQISAASRDPGTDWSRFQGAVQGLVVELKEVLSGERTAAPPALAKSSGAVSPPAAPAPIAASPPQAPVEPAPPAATAPPAPPAPAGRAISASPSPASREPARLVVAARFLDAVAAEPLRQQLLAQLARGTSQVELDLQQVEDLDAVGLTFLASARDYAARRGIELRYLRVSPGVATVLRLTGVTAVGGESAR